MGPGVISGAANDDPSCIVTFSIAGAAFGYATLWTSLFTLPLVACAQALSSRLGMVSGRGLAGGLRVRYPRLRFPVALLLLAANVVTIGADLGGMAEVTRMVAGGRAGIWAAVYGIGLTGLLLFVPYRRIQRALKWLTLALFAYIAAGLLASPDWSAALAATFLPRATTDARYVTTIVAILGATISPYFVFWQASQEVEEEYCLGRRKVAQRKGATKAEIARSNLDVLAGSVISKLITYFITLTTAATLFAAGRREIGTASDAAAALEPIAGPAASWLFALGVLGTGMLAIPVLAGSAAYALAEAMRWKASLEEHPRAAPYFYGVLSAAVALGTALVYSGVRVVDMLFWASVLNGLLAPLCLTLLALLASDPKLMGERAAAGALRFAGWAAALLAAAAAIGMAVFA